MKPHNSMFSTGILLCEDGSCCKCRGINLEKVRAKGIRLAKGRVGEDSINEGVPGLAAF